MPIKKKQKKERKGPCLDRRGSAAQKYCFAAQRSTSKRIVVANGTVFHIFRLRDFYMMFDKTNRYAVMHNRLGDVSDDEIKCFIGVLLLSGYVQLPRRRIYWDTSNDTHNDFVVKSILEIVLNLSCQTFMCVTMQI